MSDDLVLSSLEAGVLTLTLNRPERLNAWIPPLERALFDAFDEAAANPDVRVVVVTGAGRGFCPGADMDYLGRLRDGASHIGGHGAGEREGGDRERPPPRPIIHAMSIPKPVIGAVNGACAGLGLALAMSFDVRFAVPAAKFTTAFARRGLIAEHGLSWTLPRVCGLAVANDLLLSGRVLTGDEALQLGLVNRLCPPESLLDEVNAYARDMAVNCSPAALAAVKHQVQRGVDQTVDVALAEANHLMAQTIAGPDFAEGVASFTDKREPAFAPLGAGTTLSWPDGSAAS